MLCVLNDGSELFFTVVPNALDSKLVVFGSAEGIWITQGFKVSSNITSLCNAAALCHPDTAAPGEFTSSREGGEIKLFSKGRRSPVVAASLRKSEAWSLSKSQIYFNFLPSRWDTPSLPTHPPTHLLQQVCMATCFCNMLDMHVKWARGWTYLSRGQIGDICCQQVDEQQLHYTCSPEQVQAIFGNVVFFFYGWACCYESTVQEIRHVGFFKSIRLADVVNKSLKTTRNVWGPYEVNVGI